jgi:hypothetical protein
LIYDGRAEHDCVCNPLYENVYDKQPNTIQPFGLRVNTHFENSDINLDDIAPIVIPENSPSVCIAEYSDVIDLISAKCC